MDELEFPSSAGPTDADLIIRRGPTNKDPTIFLRDFEIAMIIAERFNLKKFEFDDLVDALRLQELAPKRET